VLNSGVRRVSIFAAGRQDWEADERHGRRVGGVIAAVPAILALGALIAGCQVPAVPALSASCPPPLQVLPIPPASPFSPSAIESENR
jgi:hypothetical protein